MPVKTRQQGFPFTGRFLNGGVPGASDGETHWVSRNAQQVITFGHPFQRLGRSRGNIGGPFESRKLEIRYGSNSTPRWVRRPPVTTSGPWAQEYYTIPVPSTDIRSLSSQIRNLGTRSQVEAFLSSRVPLGYNSLAMNAFGAEAVDRFAPLQPAADVSTTFAEFLSERKMFSVPSRAGSAPGEYLNYQFGIAPTLSFAQDLRNAIKNQEEIVRQVARDSGRRIRRRGDVHSESSGVTESVDSSVFPAFIGSTPVTQCLQRGKLTVTEHTTKRAWFSGAFTYYLPEEGIMRTVAELDAKYGVKPGADTAWELLPFSWLVDYKTSAGSAIANLNRFASDGVVMDYGYIMARSETITRYAWQGQMRDAGGSFVPLSLTAEVIKTTLQRVPANPFGFGILPGDLSDRQLSILAALGLSYLK